MDFTKKYGTLKGQTVWVEFDDAKIELMPRGSRKAGAQFVEMLGRKQLMAMETPDADVTAGEILKIKANQIASHISNWSGISDDGDEVAFSPETASHYCYFYSDFREFIEAELDKLDKVQEDKEAVLEAVKKK